MDMIVLLLACVFFANKRLSQSLCLSTSNEMHVAYHVAYHVSTLTHHVFTLIYDVSLVEGRIHNSR